MMRHLPLFALFIAVTVAGSLLVTGAAETKPLNVLFIGIDDLRPQLRSYGYPQMKTPNFDRLATMGMQFDRAYVQQAVCSASRASLLTGCRPDSTGVNYPYSPWFNTVFAEKYKPIAEHFAENGFYTRTLGKIHHGPTDQGLSEPHFSEPGPDFLLTENQHEGKRSGYIHLQKPWEHADLPDSAFIDGQIADETVETIRRAVKKDKPFFIAPGFKKPHLPFVCPKRYYDLYSDEDIELPLHAVRGKDQPEYTISNQTGASKWWKYPDTGIDKDNARQLIRSYYACVSFVDAQIGKILDELEAQELLDSTAIITWSDHGWHLGDHGMWGKSTNFEWATRVPLFVYVPGMKAAGTPTDALVEYVDLFPTALEIVGLPIPDYLEGTSFAPVLQDASKPWKRAAFSQFPRSSKTSGHTEGLSIRTKDFRYTRWVGKDRDDVIFEELYDERDNLLDARNLAEDPEFKEVIDEHRKLSAEGWKGALPPGAVNQSNLPRGDDSWYYRSKKDQEAAAKKAKAEMPTKGSAQTSENKPWIKGFFEKNPSADTNEDGILTSEELKRFKE